MLEKQIDNEERLKYCWQRHFLSFLFINISIRLHEDDQFNMDIQDKKQEAAAETISDLKIAS